ncbi:trwN protein [Bartonella sp. B39]
MTIQNFMMFAALCAFTVHLMSFLAVIVQRTQDDIYVTDVHDNSGLSYRASMFKEASIITDQFKLDRHNFDLNLRQINVENREQFGIFFSNVFDPCKNLEIIRAALARCYNQIASRYRSERTSLQDALSSYNAGNFKGDFTNAYVQKVTSRVQVEDPMLLDKKSQGPVKLHAERSKQEIDTNYLSVPSEELVDVFTHKASGVRDAFAAEDTSSLGKKQE